MLELIGGLLMLVLSVFMVLLMVLAMIAELLVAMLSLVCSVLLSFIGYSVDELIEYVRIKLCPDR